MLLLLLTLNKFNFAILVQSSRVLPIANLHDAASRIRTCAESEFWVCWLTVCSIANNYTKAPLHHHADSKKDFPDNNHINNVLIKLTVSTLFWYILTIIINITSASILQVGIHMYILNTFYYQFLHFLLVQKAQNKKREEVNTTKTKNIQNR